MRCRAITLAALGSLLVLTSASSPAQSLGDVARAEREKRNKESKKAAQVYSNDDVLALKAKAHKPGAPLTAETEDGRSVQVTPDQETDIIFMATWCPVSKNFKRVLNDARTRPYLAHRKLVFLFDHNEWPMIESKVIKGAEKGNYSQDDVATVLAEMKQKSGSSRMYDPTFLSDLPGQFYFCPIPDEVEGFPKVLSVRGYSERFDWLIQERDMPQGLARKLIDEYEKTPSEK